MPLSCLLSTFSVQVACYRQQLFEANERHYREEAKLRNELEAYKRRYGPLDKTGSSEEFSYDKPPVEQLCDKKISTEHMDHVEVGLEQ